MELGGITQDQPQRHSQVSMTAHWDISRLFPMPKPFLVQWEEPKPGIETEVTNFREKLAPKFCKRSGSAGIPQDSCGWRETSRRAKEKLPMDAPRWKMQKFGSVF